MLTSLVVMTSGMGCMRGGSVCKNFRKTYSLVVMKVNEKYKVCSFFFEQEYMAQVDSLLSKKRNGEILGKVFGVPFA